MTRLTLLMIILTGLLAAAVGGIAAENGAENIILNGGSRGSVPFPHRTHQVVLDDCSKCHDLFPQEAGAIDRLKKAGDLKKKKVMNASCVKCHKAIKKAGGQHGPTTCSKCHIRG